MSGFSFNFSNLPPGCSARDIEEQFGDRVCVVCGKFPESCQCPECNICGDIGNPTCYERHGLMIAERSSSASETFANAEQGVPSTASPNEERGCEEKEESQESPTKEVKG